MINASLKLIPAARFGQLLLFFLMVNTSCKGQVKTNLPNGRSRQQTAMASSQAKLVKTHGSGHYNEQYQTVSCGLRDKAGHLWFGTSSEGVYRYDGHSFTQFTEKDGLGDNQIFLMFEDKAGDIWFGSKSKISRYDGVKFTTMSIPGSVGSNFLSTYSINTSPVEKNELWSMMQDKRGITWLGTTNGIYCYDGKSFTFFLANRSILNPSNVQLKWTQCIFEDKSGALWFGSWVLANEGICRYDGQSITQYKPYGEGWIRSILEDKKGALLIVTRHNGVCRFDGASFINFTKNGGIDNTSITTALADQAGNLWLGTELGSGQLMEDGGLWRYDGHSFIKYTRKEGLCHNGVFCIVEDKRGGIWVGSRNTDLCRFDGKVFTRFSEDASKR
jgi:ligand-binding sensor domain-containing protein